METIFENSYKFFEKKELQGGKKLGQGQQGCVISPPLGSKNETLVGKLFFPFTQDELNKFSNVVINPSNLTKKEHKTINWYAYNSVKDSKHEYESGLDFLKMWLNVVIRGDFVVIPEMEL